MLSIAVSQIDRDARDTAHRPSPSSRPSREKGGSSGLLTM
jgi:hypothetical protein